MVAYTASKSQTQNRPGWSINFRHPLRKDGRNKSGLKVRRGLGTTDPNEADLLVAEMNRLLGDERWWSITRKADASQEFDARVVDAFYDDIEPVAADTRAVRDDLLPLPGRADGYSRVLLVGTTGAGKTSLVRQLIGTDPDEDRFPSTSTAKTTISETEIVIGEGAFRAAVTFFPETEIRVGIEECVFNACAAVLDRQSEDRIAERLLNHSDQRLRLSYVLGSGKSPVAATKRGGDDDWDFAPQIVAEAPAPPVSDDEAISQPDATANAKKIAGYVDRVRDIASSIGQPALDALGIVYAEASPDDQDAALELLEVEITQSNRFGDLVNDIVEDVLSRLDLVEAGKFVRKRSGWPSHWTFETEDRDEFIQQVRWFSSNYAPAFGRLLTPLVDGVRVSGPLQPRFTDEAPRLVLLDGQGLGHTPDSSASVATKITRRFSEADLILLVDNAQQPMQAAPLAVLSAIGTSGHYGKLAIAFTFFDQITGDNLPGPAEKRAHVMASARNAVGSLRETIGGGVVNALLRTVEHDAYMLGGLQWRTDRLPGAVQNELRRLVERFERAIAPPKPLTVAPIYNLLGLDFAVQAATQRFHDEWLTRLGLSVRSSVPKAHWTQVKALNRRIVWGGDSYNSLQPVADIIKELQRQVSRFLDNPVRWTREPQNEEESQEALASVRQAVFTTLHEVARGRLIDEEQPDWNRAYELRGKGSTFNRAQSIRGIFADAAPIPGPAMSPATLAFLNTLRGLVADAITASGGSIDPSQLADVAEVPFLSTEEA
jgi:energy-coupling factor transporter ATP-binding protein EcfA2